MTTQRRSIGSRRIPLHDHVDLNSGGKLTVSQAIRGGIETIQGVVSPPAGLDAGLAALRAIVNGYQAHGSMGATETFDAATGWHSGTFDANCTFTLTAATTGTVSSLFLELTQDGTGGWTLTLPASVVNKSAIEAAQDTTASTTSFLILLSRDGGTNWHGGWWGTDESASITALDELTDVEITAPADKDTLRHNGSQWVNDNRRWEPVTENFGSGPELVWDGDDLVMEWKAY